MAGTLAPLSRGQALPALRFANPRQQPLGARLPRLRGPAYGCAMADEADKTWRECFFAPRYLASDKWEAYFEIYDRCFARYRSMPAPVYLEIGCQGGGSLETARLYFGPGAKIYGIDIDPACASLDGQYGIDRVFTGDAADPAFLAATFRAIGAPDIILDDGSHRPRDVIAAFRVGFPRLADRGTYLIEDTCCDLHRSHRSVLGRSVTGFFNRLNKQLSLNMSEPELLATRFMQPLDRRAGTLQRKTGLARDIYCIAFFESIIAIEKRAGGKEPMRYIR
jgi:hypothetical protein